MYEHYADCKVYLGPHTNYETHHTKAETALEAYEKICLIVIQRYLEMGVTLDLCRDINVSVHVVKWEEPVKEEGE